MSDAKTLFSDFQRLYNDQQSGKKEGLSLFTGVVTASTAGSYTVSIMPESYITNRADGGNTMQGIVVSSHLASFIGFKEVSIPQPGSRVLCASAASAIICYVVGIIPQENLSSEVAPGRTNIGPGCASQDAANRIGHADKHAVIPNNRRPTDVVDGEYVIANEFGVLVGLFQQLATLKASELAQVQCFLLDDLVRVISHNFQHYTALGEYNVWHDGKSLMSEFGATHLPAETYGRPCVKSDSGGSPVFEKSGNNKADDSEDFYKISEDERIKSIERFKVFLGRLGDFLHIFLVRPDEDEVRTLNPDKKPTKPDTGLFDLHLGTDGGVHIRSVKEVFLEKTNWIRVPTRYSSPEDSKGDDANEISYEKKDKFEWDDSYKYVGNPMAYFLQLRDYVAYASENKAYKNFKKHEKDFYVNDDIGTEKNIKEISEVDEHTKLEQEQYKLRTAGIYLMPNGGITIRDAWNSAIVLEGGNIYIQPAKDLVLQPLRNFIAKVGGWTSIASKEDIDLSSSEKGFRLKTEKSQYFYSDNAGIVIEAHNAGGGTGSPDPATEAINNINGIVFKSDKGIYSYAETEIVNYATKNLVLQSGENVFVEADKLLGLNSKKTTVLHTTGSMIIDGESSALFLSTGGSAIFAGSSSSAFGNKDDYLGIQYDTDSIFIDVLKGAVPLSDVIPQLTPIYPTISNPISFTTFQSIEDYKKLKFKFLDSSRYGNLDPQKDAIPSTMAQQDDELTGLYSLSAWEEKEVNETLPFPGKDKFENFYMHGEAPKNLESNQTGDSYSNKAKSDTKPGKIELKSLKEYKVQA
jgi:hypothetical protein